MLHCSIWIFSLETIFLLNETAHRYEKCQTIWALRWCALCCVSRSGSLFGMDCVLVHTCLCAPSHLTYWVLKKQQYWRSSEAAVYEHVVGMCARDGPMAWAETEVDRRFVCVGWGEEKRRLLVVEFMRHKYKKKDTRAHSTASVLLPSKGSLGSVVCRVPSHFQFDFFFTNSNAVHNWCGKMIMVNELVMPLNGWTDGRPVSDTVPFFLIEREKFAGNLRGKSLSKDSYLENS